MTFPIERPRRLRSRPALRRLARETRIAAADLIYPLFVREGIDGPQPIEAMPGQSQHTLDSLTREAEAALKVGVGSFVLFGIPAQKDAQGSQAWDDDGIVQRALRQLLSGNNRYVAAQMLHPRQGVQRRAQVAPSQKPLAAILSCADSRVPPEIVFDQGLGDLFVIRVAGNTADDVALGSLEYAVDHLGVRLVMVLGHERCGAVQAAHDLVTKGEQLPGHIAALVVTIVPAVQAAQAMSGDVVDNAVTANVRMVTAQVRTTAPILSAHVQKGALNVVGARYDLESGAVTLIA